LQSPQGIPCSRFTNVPIVFTLHGPHDPKLSEFYSHYPELYYVGISEFQRRQESLPRIRTIHHGIDLSLYQLREHKQQYLSFIGRIAPIKGTHVAIDVAKRVGIQLKIAGDIQPIYRDYFEAKIKPELDGKFIEYVGLADLKAKNELLGNSLAMLFPIKWNEPFGLVMVEAMACGKPVIGGLHGGAPEVIQDGVTGYLVTHGDAVQLATSLEALLADPALAKEMGARGRQRAENEFRFNVFAKSFKKILREQCES